MRTTAQRASWLAAILMMVVGAPRADEPAKDATCTVQLSGTENLDQRYPAGSIRRQESGEVVFEFTAVPGNQDALDVRIVHSSGYLMLDEAALKLAREVKVTSPCAEQRVRWAVQFMLGPIERHQVGYDSFIDHSVASVLLVRDESKP